MKASDLQKMWNHVSVAYLQDPANVAKYVPGLIKPEKLQFKDTERGIEVTNFSQAVENEEASARAKRFFLNWIRLGNQPIKTHRDVDDGLLIDVGGDDVTEAAIGVLRRDPKTNKAKKVFKCIGGKKDGRKVSNPNACLKAPDVAKKIKFANTKHAKAGAIARSKTKTKLTNINAKRIQKANARIKAIRGM